MFITLLVLFIMYHILVKRCLADDCIHKHRRAFRWNLLDTRGKYSNKYWIHKDCYEKWETKACI